MKSKLIDLTRDSIIKKIVASLLVIALTMVNFIVVGMETVSYAVDVFEVGTPTNNKNVTFDCYFKDTEGKILSEKSERIDSNNMSLFLQVSVKNDGYFNGTISLGDSNFKLKNEVLSSGINKIEGNTITLNQINSGELVEIEVGIEPLKEDTINSGFLNMSSQVSLNGIYRNSKEKDINISSTREARLILDNPYTGNEGIELSSNIITNKVFSVNGENKRIVQLLVESGLKDNAYPVKENNLEISVPNEVEDVEVISRGMLSSNGKNETYFNADNWTYVKEEQKVKVSIKNQEENNSIKWIKNGKDKIIVTYIMNENANIQETGITAKSSITLYDTNNTIKEGTTTAVVSEEKDGTITSEFDLQEPSIYKGKIYSNENRDYQVRANIQINKANVGKNVDTVILPSIYQTARGELDSNIQYKSTTINKESVLRVIGTDGSLTIFDASNGNKLGDINNYTETDENGNVTINYPEGVNTIKVETTGTTGTGTITLNNTKTIKEDANSRDVKASYTGIVERFSDGQAVISLQDVSSKAKLQINKTSLSTMTKNTGVELVATLKTNSEEDELYKNPTIKLQLPFQVEGVEINDINLLYENELQIASTNVHNENGAKVIEINLVGEQTKHNDGNIEGATIIIDANFTLNKKATNSSEKIIMTYTNQNAGTSTIEQPIEVASPRGMVTVNSIQDYGMSVIGEEETQTQKLALGESAKDTKINIEVINNNEGTVNNVKVLGEFPTKNETNTIETKVSGLEVSGADAKVYYTENEKATDNLEDSSNGWTTEISNNSAVKKYLIAVDSMEKSQDLAASYNVNIPEGLQYNELAYEGYKVTYNNANTANEIAATTLGLSTGKGPELKASLKAKLGNTELSNGADVLQGEFLKYEVTVENTGTETSTNANVSCNIPDGTVYVEPKGTYESGCYNELTDKKEVTANIESLAPGQNVKKYFEVKVTKNAQINSEIENKAIVKYGEATAESETIRNRVKEGDLSLTVKRATDSSIDNYRNGYIEFFFGVENISNKTLKDVNVNLNIPEELEITKMFLINESSEGIETSRSVKINEIPAGEMVYIDVHVAIKGLNNEDTKDISISSTATVNNSKEAKSNECVENLKDFKLNISLSANNENGYIKTGDIVEYTLKIDNVSSVDSTLIDINDIIPKELTVREVTINNENLEIDDNNVILASSIPANSSVEAKIKAVVNYDEERTEPVIITNVANVSNLGEVLSTSEEITHILQAETIMDDPNNPENQEEPGDEPGNNNGEPNNVKGLVSGTAWLDENQDGQKDSNEKLLSGINVKLLDKDGNTVKAENGNEIAATTNDKGFYMLSDVPQGEYIVIFDYDTSKYATTLYKKDGVVESKNSDAILKQLTVNGEQKTLGVTDKIQLNENGVSNIDLGLISATKFDLELNKYISKIVVRTNKETKTYNYDKATLAKAEIAAKQLQGSNVIIEYQIEVKNAGEIAGYVKNIVDYMPSSLQFSSELNKDWYQSGTNLYNESLANTKLLPGETKLITLTLTKSMTEENTGLVNNKAEIAESFNEAGVKDIDSTAGNKVQKEDDMGSADVIIGVKTGAMITYISLTLSVMIVIGIGAYLIKRKIDEDNNIEVNF